MNKDLFKTDFAYDYRMAMRIFAYTQPYIHDVERKFLQELKLGVNHQFLSIVWVVLMVILIIGPLMIFEGKTFGLILSLLLGVFSIAVIPVLLLRLLGYTKRPEYKSYVNKHFRS